MDNGNSVPAAHLQPSASPGFSSPTRRVPGTLTARAGGSAATATAVARPGGRAERPRTWLEGVRLQGGNRSPPPTPDHRSPSPASPDSPHSKGRAGKRGMEREEREGRGCQGCYRGEERGLGRRAPVVLGGGREEETESERPGDPSLHRRANHTSQPIPRPP